jgi:hypothetical protein
MICGPTGCETGNFILSTPGESVVHLLRDFAKPVSPTVGVLKISEMNFPGRWAGLRSDAPLGQEDEGPIWLRLGCKVVLTDRRNHFVRANGPRFFSPGQRPG